MKCMPGKIPGVAGAALLVFSMSAVAQVPAAEAGYPSRPIRVIVPYAPGGGTDVIARLVAQDLTQAWGQSVVVDNRAGGAGVVGTQLTVRSTPDGHTMVLASLGFSYPPRVLPTPPYDVEKDLAPISLVATQPFIYVVLPSLRVNTMKDLIALAKAKPREIRYGSGGVGGASYLGTEHLRLMAGIELTHVPYKGTGQALTAMLSGEIHVQLTGISTVVPHIKSGRMRALAVSGAKRSSAAPEVPTVAESGVPGYEFDVWYGMLFPAGTPRPIVGKVNAEINRVLKSPSMMQRFAGLGLEPTGSTIEEFARIVRDDVAKWTKVIKSADTRTQ